MNDNQVRVELVFLRSLSQYPTLYLVVFEDSTLGVTQFSWFVLGSKKPEYT